MGLVRKKIWLGLLPTKRVPPFAEREGFTLCIPNAPAGAQQMASSFGAGALPNTFFMAASIEHTHVCHHKKHLVGIAPNQTNPPFAEREGFEPPVPLGTPVFKTGVIDHSTIFP